MDWIGGLAIDGRGPQELSSALDELYGEAGYTRLEDEGRDTVGDERALIIAGTKGWTAVYLESSERDAAFALALSERLATTVICHRAILYDAFWLLSYKGGALIDEYQSCPDYFKSYGEADASSAELARSAGNSAALKAAVPRIDAALLGEIYEGARLHDLEAALEAVMPVDEALKKLRSALQIGTFEHAFEELWWKDLTVEMRFLAYMAPVEPRKGVLDKLRERAEMARAGFRSSVDGLRRRVKNVVPGGPEEDASEDGAEPKKEPANATKEELRAPIHQAAAEASAKDDALEDSQAGDEPEDSNDSPKNGTS